MKYKMQAKPILAILVSLSVVFSLPVFATSRCSALDMTHVYAEEKKLLEQELVYTSCWGHQDDECEKYLFRYEYAPALINRFKELIKENQHKNIKKVVQKIGIGATGLVVVGTGLCFYPIKTITAIGTTMLGLSTTCAVHKKIIEQSGEAIALVIAPGKVGFIACVVSFLAKQLTKIKNWWTGDKPLSNVDVGTVGNLLNALCGDVTKENQNYGVIEGVRSLVFGNITKSDLKKIKKYELYSRLLKSLYSQIKDGDFKGNDIIVLSTDFTDLDNVKGAIKFSKTNIDLEYDRPLDTYFECE